MTYQTYEPVSLTPAPGWRAIYSQPDEPGWYELPLAAWAVWNAVRHHDRCEGGRDCSEGEPQGQEIHGAVVSSSCVMCAEDYGDLWYYLAPGEAGPGPEEVAKERTRNQYVQEVLRRQREEQKT